MAKEESKSHRRRHGANRGRHLLLLLFRMQVGSFQIQGRKSESQRISLVLAGRNRCLGTSIHDTYLPSRPKDVGNLQLYIITISGNIYFMPQVRRAAGGADLARREGASYIHNQDVEGFEDKAAIKEGTFPQQSRGPVQ